MRAAEERLMVQMAEDMYRGHVWPAPASLPARPWWRRAVDGIDWWWFDARCWLAVHVLRVRLEGEDDAWR